MDYDVRLYMDEPLNERELDKLIGKRNPLEFVRMKEPLVAELGWKKKPPTRQQLIKTLARHPELMTRPILVQDGKTVMVGLNEDILEKVV